MRGVGFLNSESALKVASSWLPYFPIPPPLALPRSQFFPVVALMGNISTSSQVVCKSGCREMLCLSPSRRESDARTPSNALPPASTKCGNKSRSGRDCGTLLRTALLTFHLLLQHGRCMGHGPMRCRRPPRREAKAPSSRPGAGRSSQQDCTATMLGDALPWSVGCDRRARLRLVVEGGR